MPRVYVLTGRAAGRSFALGEGGVLGRGDESDARLPDGSVSRRHAELRRDGARWVLVDLGSSNGTTYRGRRVSRCALADGDEVTLGRVALRFRTADDAVAVVGSGGEPDPDADDELSPDPGATELLPPRSGRTSGAPPRSAAPSRTDRRAEHLASLRREDPGGLFTGDLQQRPFWVRWTVYLLVLALAGGAAVLAFKAVQLLRGG